MSADAENFDGLVIPLNLAKNKSADTQTSKTHDNIKSNALEYDMPQLKKGRSNNQQNTSFQPYN